MSRPTTLQRWGSDGWSLIGVLAVAAVTYSALARLSGLVIPLVIATVIGMLAVPLVDALERWRVPPSIGAVLVMIATPDSTDSGSDLGDAGNDVARPCLSG